MVWPTRGAFGAIGGYGLNVLKLLQGSHRCCRYAPAANPEESSQDNPASPSAIARILYRGPGAGPSSLVFSRRPLTEGARDARGPKGPAGPRRLATSRLVEVLCASPFTLVRAIGKASRTSAKPKSSRARCLRFAPHRPRWSHFSRVMPVGAAPRLPTDEAMALGRRPLTGRPGLPAVRELGAQTRRAGPDSAWTAGPLHRISDARSCPGHRSPPRVWRR